MNLLAADSFMSTFWNKFTSLFAIANFWIATFVAILGVTFLILARRLTRVHRGVDEISNDDKVLMTYRILASICIVFALIVWIFFC